MSVLVAVTDHAAERFRQRIGGRTGEVDPRAEIVRRVAEAHAAGRVRTSRRPARRPRGAPSTSATSSTARSSSSAGQDGAELVVITLWETEGGPGAPRVPRQFTDALKRPER